MLTGRTRPENFSSSSFSYTVRGLARLNISPASALHNIKIIAQNKGIWDYINPSLVQQPRLPIKPEYPNPQRINTQA
jgi:hypothetical protein